MRRRLGLYGASDEALALLPLLEANPSVELAVIFDPDPALVRERLHALGAERLEWASARLTDDPHALEAMTLHAVIDSGLEPSFAERFPEVAARGVQIVAPLTARLLFGYGVSARDRRAAGAWIPSCASVSSTCAASPAASRRILRRRSVTAP